jgi:hypothetical protein
MQATGVHIDIHSPNFNLGDEGGFFFYFIFLWFSFYGYTDQGFDLQGEGEEMR